LLGYLPLATTVLAALFAAALFVRWRRKRAAHLFWWGLGVSCYGLGTALEGTITLRGSSVALVKAWYVAGALLGAWPLSQGTAFLLLRRRTAQTLTWILVPVVCLGALLVILSPVDETRLVADRPSPAILLWTAARAFAPFVNVYAAVLLVGGAALSSVRFARRRDAPAQALGNVLIALGALLPALGGSIARHGAVEPLYVTEFLGLGLIGAGYFACIRASVGQSPEVR
jgi:hypothetical protein